MAGLNDLIETARQRLYTGVVADVLDAMRIGGRVMEHQIRPIDDGAIVVGRARTALFLDVFHVAKGENPYDGEIDLVDGVKPGDVVVIAGSASLRYAAWGELLSTATKARGGLGCVLDGVIRDVKLIRAMQLPVFCAGIRPLESGGRGKIVDLDVPVTCAGAVVAPGDLVFADIDGVVIVPEASIDEVLRRALEKVSAENKTRDAIRGGLKLREAYDKFGVL